MAVLGELSFAYADLYPNFGGVDTSNKVQPENDDQDALNEDVAMAEKSNPIEASKTSVFATLGILILLVIFFGGGK